MHLQAGLGCDEVHYDENVRGSWLPCAGTLSPDWGGNGTVLRALSLGKNNLTGSIPDSWASLVANAQQVDLSSNRLWRSLGISWVNNTRNPNNTWSLSSVKLR
jgi:hypothetical protein